MKRRKRWGCLAVILLFTIVAAVFGLHWAWKYYGLPEWPDRREYKTIEERAEKALAFARRHNMNAIKAHPHFFFRFILLSLLRLL